MDGPTQKQYGILLLDKGVDGWVGWRAYRYQIIQELEKPVGKEGGVIWRSISSLLGWCAGYLTLFPSLLSFCSLSSLTRWLRDFCHFLIVFWEIIRVRVKTGRWEYQTERLGSRGPLLVSHFALLLLLRYSGIYRRSFLASCISSFGAWYIARSRCWPARSLMLSVACFRASD